ncbi:6-phospho-beta-glucosidase [Kineosporiaceae bacterium SCSIO 59966]|nr:6-phospho-beta-glucosidase [Kineosporiaceae bacterium SCSIO 59966]
MKLTIIGGGGFRVPQIFAALAQGDQGVIDELCLHDVSPERVAAIGSVLTAMSGELHRPPRVTVEHDLTTALTGAGFVFSAMRVGGTHGRIQDERIALDHGLLGQETIGPGGLAYALRTLPEARRIAQEIRRVAPEAWVINFTNPAGIITEGMRAILGDRVTGICDTPIGLVRRAARAAGRDVTSVEFDYVGLNHLGWLRSLSVDGTDVLPRLLDDPVLESMEEAQIFGTDWLRALGAIPNEYLFYYYFTRETVTRIRSGGQTRGEYIQAQQDDFYSAALSEPARSLDLWRAARHDREASYMGETRAEKDRYARNADDVEEGGYQQVALDLMTALTSDRPATMILNVPNSSAESGLLVPQLPDDAVVEVPCRVDQAGIHPHQVSAVGGELAGLMVQVKTSERLVIEASATKSAQLAWRAFANHPLVDSVDVAKDLLGRYRSEIPEVGRALEG